MYISTGVQWPLKSEKVQFGKIYCLKNSFVKGKVFLEFLFTNLEGKNIDFII